MTKKKLVKIMNRLSGYFKKKNTITPKEIEDFFSWYTSEKRWHRLFHDLDIIEVGDNQKVEDITYMGDDNGTAVQFALKGKYDPNRVTVVEIGINSRETILSLKTADTYTNFDKQYRMKTSTLWKLSPDDNEVVFAAVRDIMHYCITTKIAYMIYENKEGIINEAIPLRIFRRGFSF